MQRKFRTVPCAQASRILNMMLGLFVYLFICLFKINYHVLRLRLSNFAKNDCPLQSFKGTVGLTLSHFRKM